MIHLHSSFFRNWNNKQMYNGFVYHPLIRVTKYERAKSLFSGKVYSYVLEADFLQSWRFHMSLFARWNFFIGFASYWCSTSSISFGAFQCSAQIFLRSPAEYLAEDNSLLPPYQPAQDRREHFTGIFQISPIKRIVKLCVLFQWTTSYMPLLPTFAYLFVQSLHLARVFFLDSFLAVSGPLYPETGFPSQCPCSVLPSCPSQPGW